MVVPILANVESVRRQLDTDLQGVGEVMRHTVPPPETPLDAVPYRKIQEAVPAGARMLVMVDKPQHFNFARNEIWNLDMPGASSPSPGIPMFQGPGPLRQYLENQGIRYLVFVDPAHSAFNYRRQVWRDHLLGPEEIRRIYAPYMLDTMDNLTLLAGEHPHLAEAGAMTVLDLQGRQTSEVPPVSPGNARDP
jgi:hypothetical protein